jgi:hypothetical protein
MDAQTSGAQGLYRLLPGNRAADSAQPSRQACRRRMQMGPRLRRAALAAVAVVGLLGAMPAAVKATSPSMRAR